MALFSLNARTTATVAGAAIVDLATTATDRIRVREIGFSSTAATAAQVGLIRSSAIGTRTSPVTGLAGDFSEPAGTGTVATAWSVAPTLVATYLRRFNLPAAIGAGLIWSFGPNDLLIPVSGSLVLANFGVAANPIMDVYLVWEE